MAEMNDRDGAEQGAPLCSKKQVLRLAVLYGSQALNATVGVNDRLTVIFYKWPSQNDLRGGGGRTPDLLYLDSKRLAWLCMWPKLALEAFLYQCYCNKC